MMFQEKKEKDPWKDLSAIIMENRYKEEERREIIGEEWRSMGDNQKKPYEKQAAKDKKRYVKAMASYVPPPVQKGRKKRAKKDPNAPKRNQSAFFLYSNATRADIKAAQPDLAFGEIAKVISVNFKALPAEERAYWDEKAAADKERYQREMAAYKGEA